MATSLNKYAKYFQSNVIGSRSRTPTKHVRGEDLRAGEEAHQRTGNDNANSYLRCFVKELLLTLEAPKTDMLTQEH